MYQFAETVSCEMLKKEAEHYIQKNFVKVLWYFPHIHSYLWFAFKFMLLAMFFCKQYSG